MDLVRWLPGLTHRDCAAARLQATDGARSVQGQPFYWRDVAAPDARLRVLVVGGLHGDEMSASSLAMRWLALADAHPAGVHWRFLPVLNPDGMFRPTPQRTNARGVDLNRNFPTPNWTRESRVYWEQRARKDPRRYPGPTPLSEPESRFLHAEMARFQPQLIVSLHAPYGLLDFDGPAMAPPRRIGRLHLDPLGIYPGSLGHYGGVHRGMPVVTIELPSATQPPAKAEADTMWADLLTWVRAHWPTTAAPSPAPVPDPAPSPDPATEPSTAPPPEDLPWTDPMLDTGLPPENAPR